MPKVPVVTQIQLLQIVTTRERLKLAKETVKKLEADLSTMETAVMLQITNGAKTEKGDLQAIVEKYMGPCRPAWKEAYLSHMAAKHDVSVKAAEEKLKSQTKVEELSRLSIMHVMMPKDE